MRKRYVVQANGTYEGFTAPAIESMKKLGLIEFRSTSRTNSGITYKYSPKVRKF